MIVASSFLAVECGDHQIRLASKEFYALPVVGTVLYKVVTAYQMLSAKDQMHV